MYYEIQLIQEVFEIVLDRSTNSKLTTRLQDSKYPGAITHYLIARLESLTYQN
jgi:hypothetical protein